MPDSIRSFVTAPFFWRALVGVAVIGARVMLDDVIPRGRMGRITPVWLSRR